MTVSSEACSIAMGYLEGLLEGNTTEVKIRESFDYVRSLVPVDYKLEVESLVNQYADSIVQLIVSKLATPATMCMELGLSAV